MADLQARERVLEKVVNHARTAGIADLSLRELAEAVGTSHRMLLYHFGSRTGLLTAVTENVEETERQALLGSPRTREDARESWDRLSDPALGPQERLFFELYVHALLGRPGTEHFLDGIIDDWVEPMAAAMVEAGGDGATARVDARLGLATVRGLLLDLLATGDREGTTKAYERFLRCLAAQATPTSREPGAGAAERSADVRESAP
jgi:AcrR family transcriptional regulator